MLTNTFSLRNTLCSTPQADPTCCERSNLRPAQQPLFLLTPILVWPRVKRLPRQMILLRTHLPIRWPARKREGSSFSPLEGTQKECDKLTGLFEAWHWKAESFTDKDASKEALFHVHFPYIPHFATHGFFEAADRSVSKSNDRPISDETTIQIMSDFYEAAHTSGNAPQALAEVQRNWLVRLRTERGLAQAVNLAGPFTMSSQGAP
jgi:CHAT domain